MAEALAEKVIRGELLEEDALKIGRQIMRENALELFPQLRERLWRRGHEGVRLLSAITNPAPFVFLRDFAADLWSMPREHGNIEWGYGYRLNIPCWDIGGPARRRGFPRCVQLGRGARTRIADRRRHSRSELNWEYATCCI